MPAPVARPSWCRPVSLPSRAPSRPDWCSCCNFQGAKSDSSLDRGLRAFRGCCIQRANLVVEPQHLPALECQRDIAVEPEGVVEATKRERVTLEKAAFGEQLLKLQLTHLVRHRLPGIYGELGRLVVRAACVHRPPQSQVGRSLFEGELTEGQLDIDRH